MQKPIHKEWPMRDYLAAWKVFRDNCDEDEVTAHHLLTQRSWPRTERRLTICDIGCGDGRIMRRILQSNLKVPPISRVVLLDPEETLLSQAERAVNFADSSVETKKIRGTAKDFWEKVASEADVAIAVHVAYLMVDKELNDMLDKRPAKTRLYVVLDAPDSVFTALWKETAQKYYLRAKSAHRILKRHIRAHNGSESRISSRIPVRLLEEQPWGDWILSILCYRSMRNRVDVRLRSKVDSIIRKHLDTNGEHLICASACYSIG